jgi:Cohesin domain
MRFITTICICVLGFGFFVLEASAAVVSVERELTSLRVGDEFTISVVVDSEGKILNAVEMEIVYPAEFLEYTGSSDGDSVINFWIERPTYQEPNRVRFSGITPGGFSDRKSQLLSLNFKVIQEGQGKIEMDQVSVLVHDGLGSEDTVMKQNLHLSSSKGQPSASGNSVDDETPESFTPEIIQDEDLYDGAYTLIFSTEDKGSGMNRFEVKEGFWGRYVLATSPHKLTYQSLDRKIYIKAIDTLGNERVEVFYPQNWQPWNKHEGVIISILIVCLLFLLGLGKFFRTRLPG